MRTDTAPALHIRELQRRAQLEERIAAEHGRDKWAVLFQDAVELREDRGEVVDPVYGERGEYRIEGVGFVGEGFEIRNRLPVDCEVFVEGEVDVAVEEGVRGLEAGEG